MEKEMLQNDIEELKNIKQSLQMDIIELDDKILFQNFGVYQPQYNFATLDEYKEKLDDIRNQQKEMIKSHTAAICNTAWKVQGSEKAGKKMIAENIQQALRNFNIECDLCISKVKFSNYDNSKERIFRAFELQNKLNATNDIHIVDEYYKLKIKELDLAYEYQKKKQEEKEELRRKREELREAEKVAREIEEKRKELEKEQEHYQNYLKKINEQIEVEQSEERKQYLISKKEELDNNVHDVHLALEDLDYREANHRAGYVYIISNIGAFGENIFKIGMTRRLEPEERIAELSGASVPFKFDIHAMIFSDDAPKLEAALHNHFADKKVNLVNGRKEFFNVTLEEIKKVVRDNHDKTVDFVNVPDAEQYRESLMIRKNLNAN
ncbi:MAG TPA: DUF4041 domain-containing protein [Clostridiales bacterium]|nr:DUF4041 domain-containing protein [Clostridiales bacterium]